MMSDAADGLNNEEDRQSILIYGKLKRRRVQPTLSSCTS